MVAPLLSLPASPANVAVNPTMSMARPRVWYQFFCKDSETDSTGPVSRYSTLSPVLSIRP